jgi:hypothetical protein
MAWCGTYRPKDLRTRRAPRNTQETDATCKRRYLCFVFSQDKKTRAGGPTLSTSGKNYMAEDTR